MGLIINHGAFLICSKLVDKTKIESGQIYVTISSSGKEVTKLVPNSETEKIDFVGMEYENGEPEDKVKLSLSLDEVYEVWKVEIMSPNPMGNDSSKVVVEELKIF